MKIEKICAVGFRGLRNFAHKLNTDKTLLLYGLNGTGKTSLFQALEFGLTGELPVVSALENPPVDVYRHRLLEPSDLASVSIAFTSPAGKHFLSRTLDADGNVESNFSTEEVQQRCEDPNTLVRLLTRPRFERMIDAVDRDRWSRLSPLLGHERLAAFRGGLRLVYRNLKRDFEHKSLLAARDASDAAEREARESFNELSKTVGEDDCSLKIVTAELAKISVALPETESLGNIDWKALGNSIPAGKRVQEATAEVRRIDRDLGLIHDLPLDEEQLSGLLSILKEISDDSQLGHELLHADFLNLGSRIVSGYTEEPCPLCGLAPSNWGDVRKELDNRLEQVREVVERKVAVEGALASTLHSLRRTIEGLDDCDGDSPLSSELDQYLALTRRLKDELEVAQDRLSATPPAGLDSAGRERIDEAYDDIRLWIESLRRDLGENKTSAEQAIESASQGKDLRRLLHLQEWVQKFAHWRGTREKAEKSRLRLQAVNDLVNEIEEVYRVTDAAEEALSLEILQGLEDEVARIFAAITRQDALVPKIRREESYGLAEARIEIEDFHGMGRVSAREFLSEANRNALGLAILFAGIRSRTQSLDVLVLDDITHSADNLHRRGLAHLLVGEICTSHQVLVFTHDMHWYDYLRELLESDGDGLQIVGWSPDGLDTKRHQWQPLLDEAQQKIGLLDRTGGNALRLAMEKFVDYACEAYRIAIPFKRSADTVRFEEKRRLLIQEIEELWRSGKGLIDESAVPLRTFKSSQRVANLASHHTNVTTWGQQELEDALKDVQEFIDLFRCKNTTSGGNCRALLKRLSKTGSTPPKCKSCQQVVLL